MTRKPIGIGELMTLRLVAALVILTGLIAGAFADDWPQFQGPTRTGASMETGLLRKWDTGQPTVLWSVEVAGGFAGAAVRDHQVFLLDRIGEKEDVLRCFDLETGREVWNCAYDAPGTLPYDGTRQVPTVTERRVFVVGGFGHVTCFDRATHGIAWSHHLVEDFKDPAIDREEKPVSRLDHLARAQVPRWGVSQSPVLYRDMVIVAPQTQKVGLVAYDQNTGTICWKSGYVGRNWYSHVSPYLTVLDGVEQLIMIAQPSDPEKAPASAPPAIVSSIDPNTGRILWQTQTPCPYKIPIPQPLRIGDDRLLITGGYGVGCLFLRVHRSADQWAVEYSRSNAVASHIQSPALHNSHIYVQSHKDHGGASAGLVCLDMNGRVCWETGARMQFDFGAFLLADGLIFAMHGKMGVLSLLEANPMAFKVLSQAKVVDGEDGNIWAPLALSDGKLIVRDQHKLRCLLVK